MSTFSPGIVRALMSAEQIFKAYGKSIGIGAIASIVTILITFLFFWFGVMDGNLLQALVAIVLVAVIAFLFTTVAANAIAIVGSNPVSGMTLMTLILASVVMVGVVSALLRFGGFNPVDEAWLANPLSEVCALVAYVLLIVYFVRATKSK